jgi:hypothetical protein
LATAASASGRSREERRAVGGFAAGAGAAAGAGSTWRRRFGGAFFSAAGALRLGFFLGAAAGFLGTEVFFERAGAAAGFFWRVGAGAAAGAFLPLGFLRAGAAAGAA